MAMGLENSLSSVSSPLATPALYGHSPVKAPSRRRVKSRKEYKIAIICALPLEFDAVDALLDQTYDEYKSKFKRHGDANWYRLGRLGDHSIVLVCLSEMGKGSAASAVSSLWTGFVNVELALVVGICGALPFTSEGSEILLGDVVISDSIIAYDMREQYPDGFKRGYEGKEVLGKLDRNVRSFLSWLKTRRMRRRLRDELYKHVQYLQSDLQTNWKFPGTTQDRLFEASYRHKHHQKDHAVTEACVCTSCQLGSDPVCDEALESDCNKLGCTGNRIPRKRLLSEDTEPKPIVHFGAMASADTVMKSGEHRDTLAKANKIIAFEMEGAGVWDNLPCIIIKGVSDYADSHKNKLWQNYAAATAASCAKAFLVHYTKPSQDDDIENESDLNNGPFQYSQRFQGRPLCGCICHKKHHLNTPKSLYNYFGAAYFSHSGFPVVTRPCNDPYCQNPASPSASFSLYLPPWLSKRMATFTYSHKHSPELLLRVMNMVPAGSDVFRYAADGNINGLRALFDSGRASPFDRSSDKGRSVLHVAIDWNQFDVCRFLLAEKVDPFLEDQYQVCPFDIAWDKIMSQSINDEQATHLRSLFPNTDRLEHRGFSRLHKAILNFLHLDLEEELKFSSRTAINCTDADGRTALSWAAWRGDLNATKLLVKYGERSDVDTPCKKRRWTPLHYAMEKRNVSLVQLLLQTGADPNYPDSEQLAPLHRVSMIHDYPDIVKILIDYGAAISYRDSTGCTPLMYAAQYNRAKNAKALLQHGADIDVNDVVESAKGWTALFTAIRHNSHECIRLILEYPITWSHCAADGSSLLHIAAEYADLESLRILLLHQASLPMDSVRKEDGLTAEDLASRREGVTEQWRKAFSRLSLLAKG